LSIGSPPKSLHPNAARESIGNLIRSANGAIMVAHELARVTSIRSILDELESASVQLDRLAAMADGLTSNQLDEITLGAALVGTMKLSELADNLNSPAFRHHLGDLIRAALPELGRSECAVLLCLIEHRGNFVTSHALQTAAKSRTPNTSIVKVYISRIRASLARHQFDVEVQTGKCAYRIEARSVKLLLDALGS
jgi:hypothetical protein